MLTDEELIDLEEKRWIVMRKEREQQIIYTTDSAIAAQDLYDRGFNIFPIEYGTKKTYRKWSNLYNARLPEAVIGEAFKKQNICVLVGRLSMNLFVIDCDDEKIFDEMYKSLDKLGLAKWVVTSVRGGHFWFLSLDGEVDYFDNKEKNFQVMGQKHYVMAPPSAREDKGFSYSWKKREGYLPPKLSEEEIHRIFPYLKVHTTLRYFLPNIAHEVLVNENKLNYHSYSEAEGAAVCVLMRYGWDNSSIIELFQEYQPPHFTEQKCSNEWLMKYMIQPAREFIDTPPYMDKVIRAVSWALNQSWKSRTGNTDKAVFLACCKRAMYEGPDRFRATEREVSEIAYVLHKTAHKSLRRLESAGHLIFVPNDSTDHTSRVNTATHYRINPQILNYPNKATVSDIIGVMSSTIKNHDIWHPKALGKSAQNIFEYLQNGSKTIDELVIGTNKSKPVIERALSKLEGVGLVKQKSGTWQAVNIDMDTLDKIAIDFEVFGIGERRDEQHQRERENRAWYFFRESI